MDSFLGVDVGTQYVAAAVARSDGTVVQSAYLRHQGDLAGACRSALKQLDLTGVRGAAVTGIGAERLKGLGAAVDPMVALVEGTKAAFPAIRNIIYVGAGSYSLVRLNDKGEYLGHAGNTACASGTGAFLDQQAMRLGFAPEDLARQAEGAPRCPCVATRCAVFAKTDMIHLQQEGYSPREIAAGLCGSMGEAVTKMLLKGRALKGETALCGGVARNGSVRVAIEKTLGFQARIPAAPEVTLAAGAAVIASARAPTGAPTPESVAVVESAPGEFHLQPPLEIRHSSYPEFKSHEFKINEDGTETSLPAPLARGSELKVALGIDIGSTSTKGVLMDENRRVVALAYRSTAGDPLRATQLLFRAFRQLEARHGVRFDVLCAGTTGSGRKMMKAVLRAELEKDEITAHAKAATFLDPEVDTILEIGGQDSKFTQLEDGRVVNSVMNYVCAAGTGSFIEEQAKNLGLSVWNYADFVMGSSAPLTSDRCTVFMERDLKERLAEGCSTREAAAAVLYSVRDNYLNKVVNGLRIGERVYFQGATARNKALIAAFERNLEKPILVSEFCHVTGAMGIALMLLESPPAARTFKGLDFAEAAVETSSEICELCANRCNLTLISSGGETTAWGLKCGRDYADRKPRRESGERTSLFDSRRRRLLEPREAGPERRHKVGIPRCLTTWSHLPLWKTLFAELGVEIELSSPSSEQVLDAGRGQMAAEFCAPIVMALGHVTRLMEKGCDLIFLPDMARGIKADNVTDAHFCCFIQAFPWVSRTIGAAVPMEGKVKWISPVIEFGLSSKKLARRIRDSLAGAGLEFAQAEVLAALRKGLAAQAAFDDRNVVEGAEALDKLKESGGLGVVILGRPYNVNDPGLNLDLPRKIAALGVTPIPLDSIGPKTEDLGPEWSNMYWNYGQKVLAGAETVARSDNLFGILFTNFACGPDSFMVTYFKTIMGRYHKPYLILQFDGHGADAGYMTRIEAAIESFKAWKRREPDQVRPRARGKLGKDRTVLFPPMDPYTVHLLAASFRGHGYKTEILEESGATLDIGTRHCQGGECAPCPSTLGSAINYMETTGAKPSDVAYFMPTANGPCRFGQYRRLAEIVFDKKGWEDLLIVSPSDQNAYQGIAGSLRRQAWDSIVIGDVLQKMLFRLRPYERRIGEVERTLWQAIHEICEDFAARRDPAPSLTRAVQAFKEIPVDMTNRPKIGVVGEIYLRTNHFLNQDLFKLIESLGGEVLKATLSEWFHYTAYVVKHLSRGGKTSLWDKLEGYLNTWYFESHEHRFYRIAAPVLGDRTEPPIEEVVKAGMRYVPLEFEGEAILTVGRALTYFERERVDAVVNASPTFCMPGTITTALFARIEEEVGKPIVCLFYDGSGNPNQCLVPHLHYLKERIGALAARPEGRTVGARV